MMQQAGEEPRPAHAKTRWGTISREQLVLAAMDEIAAGRYQQMTIRRLAARLGVAPMSLYRHVRDKEDLLNEVVDRLLSQTWEPTADPSDAWAWLTEAADRFRRFLVEQPAALSVFLAHPVTSPAAMTRLRSTLAVLQRGGLDEPSARRLFAAVHTYTLGFAALEASRARWLAANSQVPHPETAWLAALTGPEQFSDGLAALLDGVRRASAPAS
jgi:TetR/AcrR family transcriptional regulator, tetracycline repressor protein